MMDVRPLHTQQDYEWALAEVARYFDHQPAPGTDDGDRFEVLSTLIKDYEDRHVEIPQADPIEVLRFAIESMGKSQSELADLLGSRSRASEVLNKNRRLTLDMMRTISAAWGIPIEVLTPHYELARDSA
ncbi:helix-turn-helix domain-containing protein [Pseudorhodoplanes sinuspersici]|nr:HTH-type transcriptional regulator/antitoxin HigA [Pseudorhodoplanes sinuspersici]